MEAAEAKAARKAEDVAREGLEKWRKRESDLAKAAEEAAKGAWRSGMEEREAIAVREAEQLRAAAEKALSELSLQRRLLLRSAC